MKNSRNLIKYIYQFVDSLDDNDLKKLCNGEYKIILDKNEKKNLKNNNNDKIVKKSKSKKKVVVDVSCFEKLHNEILSCNNREDAKKILQGSNFRKCDLLSMGEFYNVQIPKSYNKGKMISILVEFIVGNKIDDNSICQN